MDVGEGRELEDECLRRPGEACERGREHEREQLVLLGPVAERDRPGLVLPDGLQDLAERRVDRAVDQEEPDEKDRQHDEVERQRLSEVEHPQERAPRHRLDAVLAAGEVGLQAEEVGGLQAEEVDHLREGERDVREVDALAPDRERADDDSERGRDRGPEADRQLRRKPPDLRGVRRAIAGRAQKDGVAEREEPDVADEEVERAGEQGEAERLHEEDRVHEERRRHERGRHHHEGDELVDRHPRHRGDSRAHVLVRRRRHVVRPKRPAGLTSSTSAMMTKITVLDASG